MCSHLWPISGREALVLPGTCRATLLLTIAGLLAGRVRMDYQSSHGSSQLAVQYAGPCAGPRTQINQTQSHPRQTAHSSAAGGCARGWEEVAGGGLPVGTDKDHRQGVRGSHLFDLCQMALPSIPLPQSPVFSGEKVLIRATDPCSEGI